MDKSEKTSKVEKVGKDEEDGGGGTSPAPGSSTTKFPPAAQAFVSTLLPFAARSSSSSSWSNRHKRLVSLVRSLLRFFPASPCRMLTMDASPGARAAGSLGSRVTGTLFGHRKGHVHFAVQEDPRSTPVLLLELTTATSSLVKEMASGLVRIALECERKQGRGKLFAEPVWTMYCNGRRTGYALQRQPSASDLHILALVQAVSMGAGVLPNARLLFPEHQQQQQQDEEAEEDDGGELMYMRARFERVVGSKDSEAFYMMNPDGTGGPELSIFLLRI